MNGILRLGFVLLATQLLATTIDYGESEWLNQAQNWQSQHMSIYPRSIKSLRAIQHIKQGNEHIAVALFPDAGGYLIFSCSQESTPLIAVSDRGWRESFNDDHPLIRLLKKDLPNRIYRAQQNPNEQLEHALEWQALENNEPLVTTPADTIIFNPTPVWGQGWAGGSRVFNLYTPNYWSTGCVATALAEILAYYQWPLHPTGSNAYWDDGVNLSVNYEGFTYDWANTLDNYSDVLSNSEQKEAAGLLSYHTAVSVNMDFEAAGSTANTYDGVTALHDYFRNSGHYTSSGASDLFSQIIANLEDGRPVAMAVDGPVDHAVVADGYASQYGLFHINYGWDGDSNGWYDITGAFLPGYNYTIIGVLKGIVPNPEINRDVQWSNENSFLLEWLTSDRLNADHYELQQKIGSGVWTTLSAEIADTSYTFTALAPGTYWYRVRAYRDSIWWDYSKEYAVSIGEDVSLEFFIDMQDRPLSDGEALVLLGNIDPLGNVQNSPEFNHLYNGIYAAEVIFENSYIGDTLLYRFGVQGSNYQDIETFNREYPLSALPAQSLDTVRFNLPLGISDESTKLYPDHFSLGAVYPNPFNGSLSIPLIIKDAGVYEIQIYDLTGRVCGNPIRKTFSSGTQTAQIDFNRLALASGVYIIQVRNGSSSFIKKCQFLK